MVKTSQECGIVEEVKVNETSIGTETITKGPRNIRNKKEVTFSPVE